jgi:predicted transcriptional regulator
MAQSNRLNAQTAETLFPAISRFHMDVLGRADAQRWTDNLIILRELILSNQGMYPNIDQWFAKKVVPGLRSSERIAYIAYENEKPIATAILKLGDKSKFCHLRIQQDFQDMDLGQMFFVQMALQAYGHAKEIHFTLPESLWLAKNGFFQSFGFTCARKASRQYRNGDVELLCSAPFTDVWSAALSKLPALLSKFSPTGISLKNQIMISVKPKYAEQILSGSKVIEVRKKFSHKWVGCKAVLYSSRPVSAVVGEATIDSVTYGHPSDIWSKWESHLGCSWKEFQSYVASASQVSAIQLRNATPYSTPVSLDQLSHLVRRDLRPPQSFCDLRPSNDNPWAKATLLISLLQSHVGNAKALIAQ